MSDLGIRPVHFAPPLPGGGPVELTSLDRMRRRGGLGEFTTSQRLGFDLLMRIEEGHATHTIDFTAHDLAVGDVLWIRTGQVHRWGAISDIEGTVVLLAPHVIDEQTRELITNSPAAQVNHWPADTLQGSSTDLAWALLQSTAGREVDQAPDELHAKAVEHELSALLLLLLALARPHVTPAGPPHTHEAYLWFRDEIEQRFERWHQVNQYAARLGYSARTLNRLSRANTGLSAKQVIDERIILEAKRLLSHAHAPVAEVASQLGFDDPSNFSSYFLTRTGLTPGGFRRQQT